MNLIARTSTIVVKAPASQFPIQIFDTPLCLEITRSIFEGKAYPRVDFVKDVRLVVDVGAYIGAASIYFALQFPEADVLSFEPYPPAFELLKHNTGLVPNIRPHDFGLFDRDCETPLFVGNEDSATNSVGSSYLNSNRTIPVRLRHAGKFLREQLPERKIDILKLDTEGCEWPILQSIADSLEGIKVIYLEYHDEADRLAIDALLSRTHILASANLRHPHRGELCYVAYGSYPSREAIDKLRIRRDTLPHAASRPAAHILTTSEQPPMDRRTLCDVAVVMPTVLRPSLNKAVQSVFEQRIDGRGQLLIGVDRALGDRQVLDEILAKKPEHWTVSIFDPGYSTSARHGGLHAARDGGALRTILSYAAHSRYIAYLDDDNWWAPNHLHSLLTSIRGHEWSYSKRWFVDPDSLQPLCEDNWESVGPDQGVFHEAYGGFVDPNTLLIDKVCCESVLRWWTLPLGGDRSGMSADRHVFHFLRRHHKGIATNLPTCYYVISKDDDIHAARMERIKQAMHRNAPARKS